MQRSPRVPSSSATAWFFVTLFLSATATAAQITTADVWKKKSAEIQGDLRAENWERAERKSRQLGRILMDSVEENDAASDAFGLVAAWRAIALEELGDHENAEWWWLSARILSEKVATFDFGVESSGLDRLRSFKPEYHGLGERAPDPRLVPPRIVAQETPHFPKNLEREGRVEVWGIVETSGQLVGPLIVKGTARASAKLYAALDSIARWRVEPGTVDGVPTPVLFGFTVEFKVVP
jgi:hypothetical protein